MTDYYTILGLKKDASLTEIKSAFRKLAKIYHPDKNPNKKNAKLLFENILVAYSTLSNPSKKRRYDDLYFTNSQSHSVNKSQSKVRTHKDGNVSAEELQQRQYYQNYYKTKQKAAHLKPPVKTYTDYKYILYATPLAVGLLLLIVSMFSPSPITQKADVKKDNLALENASKPLVNGDKPYAGFFGESKISNSKGTLKINNSSSFDAIIVLFSIKKNEYIQHAYLQKGFLIEFIYLPKEGIYWKCIIGNRWNASKLLFNKKVIGCFDSIVQFQNWKTQPVLFTNDNSEVIEILDVINAKSKNKIYISNEFDFFEN